MVVTGLIRFSLLVEAYQLRVILGIQEILTVINISNCEEAL